MAKIQPFHLRQGFGRDEFNELLVKAFEMGVSDISAQSNGAIIFHLHGEHIPVTTRPILHHEMQQLAITLYQSDNALSLLSGGRDLDPRYEFNYGRGVKLGFRVNITKCRVNGENDGIAITLRALPQSPKTLAELKRPSSLADAMFQKQGLVIVVGATGSGKSTLLAGAIREILELGRDHKILTYEKPIEYTYDTVERDPSNIIFQHEIGRDLMSFEAGVRNALRRAPTEILVGEARDQETIDATIEATLTGHTTYTTVHAETVGGAISRMVQSYEYQAHSSISEKLVSALRLIVVQRLVRNVAGNGRVAINEWLVFGKEEKRMLNGVKSDSLAPTVDAMVMERGTSMAHHAAFECSRGNISIENAAASSGVSISEIERLIGVVNPLNFETREERDARLNVSRIADVSRKADNLPPQKIVE